MRLGYVLLFLRFMLVVETAVSSIFSSSSTTPPPSPPWLEAASKCPAPILSKASCTLEAVTTGQCRPVVCRGASYSSQALLSTALSTMKDGAILHAQLAHVPLLSPPEQNRFLCSPMDPSSASASDVAILASRGVCPFGSKARVAQASAAALLLIDASSPRDTGPNVAPSFEQEPDVVLPAAMVGGLQDLWEGQQDWHLSMNVSVTVDELSQGFLQEGKRLMTNPSTQRQAHECLQAAVETQPSNIEAHYTFANFFAHHHHVEGAYWHYMQALGIDGDHLPSLTNLPSLLYKYDIPGLSTPAKENSFQYCRCKAQEVVVQEMNKLRTFNHTCSGGLNLVREWRGRTDMEMLRVFPHQGEVCQVYGAERPFVADEEDLDDFPLNPMDTDPWDNMYYVDKEVYFAIFKGDVHVSGDPAVITHKCQVFIPSPGCMVPLHSLLDAPINPKHYHRVLLAHQMSCDNYYHYTFECLPRLLLLLDYIISEDPSASRLNGTTLVLPGGYGGGRKFIDDSLQEIARTSFVHGRVLQGMDIMYYEPLNGSFTADEVVTVDWRVVDSRPGLELCPARVALQRLRSFFLPDLTEAGPRDLLVYVSRNQDVLSGKASRRVSNEEQALQAIRRLLVERGSSLELAVFHGDSTSLHDTVAMFSRAAIVVALHGAGLSNMVYSQPKTHIVEVALKTPRHRDYTHGAMALDHHYWIMLGPDNALESEVALDEYKLMETLRAVLDHMEGEGSYW